MAYECRRRTHAACKNYLPVLLGGLGIVFMALGFSGCRTFTGLFQSRGNYFSIVVMPDTQNYTDSSFGGQPKYFYDQTQWIKANKRRFNIVMVAHAGDIVQNPDEFSEWKIADRAFKTIDKELPYILCLGNHDLAEDQSADDDARDTLLNAYFPPYRFTNNPVYRNNFGPEPQAHFMEPGRSDNYYLYFGGGGTQFLIIALEFKPRDETLEWANQVIESHPEHRCVVLTHGYLSTDGSRGMGNYALPGNRSPEIWEKLVSQHENIFLVLCGHALGEAVLTSTGKAGNSVQQVLTDYQNDYIGNGGHGYLRIMTFYPNTKEIRNRTYSPSLGTYLSRQKSHFTLKYD
jgi:hypothetical protein